MKRCAIMQPTYMPWAGYLNLMVQVDLFVYLDDAQFERGTWHNRNRVLVAGQVAWLTVPVRRPHLGARLNEVAPDDQQPWRRKHGQLLRQAYAHSEFAADLVPLIDALAEARPGTLADLDIGLIEGLRLRLGITTPTLRSSALDIGGTRTQRVMAILDHLGATDYVAAPGSLDYLSNDGFSERAHQRLHAHAFEPTAYCQRGVDRFESHLSILDVIGHLGWRGASQYIRSGMNNPSPSSD